MELMDIRNKERERLERIFLEWIGFIGLGLGEIFNKSNDLTQDRKIHSENEQVNQTIIK